MKREVERSQKLPAFVIPAGDLEVLWNRLTEQFNTSEKIRQSIDISLENESLEFDSIAELKSYGGLPDKITKFTIRMYQNGRSLSLRVNAFSYGPAVISASAESGSWCAGVIEVASSFFRSYQAWYNWLVKAPIFAIFVVIVNAPLAIIGLLNHTPEIPLPAAISWVSVIGVIGFLLFFRSKLFPPASIIIRETDGIIKRNSAELSVILAAISVAIAIFSLFYRPST